MAVESAGLASCPIIKHATEKGQRNNFVCIQSYVVYSAKDV